MFGSWSRTSSPSNKGYNSEVQDRSDSPVYGLQQDDQIDQINRTHKNGPLSHSPSRRSSILAGSNPWSNNYNRSSSTNYSLGDNQENESNTNESNTFDGWNKNLSTLPLFSSETLDNQDENRGDPDRLILRKAFAPRIPLDEKPNTTASDLKIVTKNPEFEGPQPEKWLRSKKLGKFKNRFRKIEDTLDFQRFRSALHNWRVLKLELDNEQRCKDWSSDILQSKVEEASRKTIARTVVSEALQNCVLSGGKVLDLRQLPENVEQEDLDFPKEIFKAFESLANLNKLVFKVNHGFREDMRQVFETHLEVSKLSSYSTPKKASKKTDKITD